MATHLKTAFGFTFFKSKNSPAEAEPALSLFSNSVISCLILLLLNWIKSSSHLPDSLSFKVRVLRTWWKKKHTFQMHDCMPNLTPCHSVLRSGGEAICRQHARMTAQPLRRTHVSHILCVSGRGRVGYNELVPSRLSAKVSQWCCLRESNVRHANRCGLSVSAHTHMRTSARFPMHEECPLRPDRTAHVHHCAHPCPFHLHSRVPRHTSWICRLNRLFQGVQYYGVSMS